MSKALKTAALVVGAVALVATGIGAAGGFAAAAAAGGGAAGAAAAAGATVAGISVGTFTAIGAIAGAVSAGLSLVAGAVAKKPSVTISGNQTRFTASLDQGVPWVIGVTATAGCAVHDITFDANGSTNNAYQTFFGVWSGDRVNAIRAYQIDGTTVTFAVDPKVPSLPDNAVGAYNKWMFLRTQLGTEAQALTATGFEPYPPGWSASSRLAGMGAFAWTLKFDTTGKVYPSGTVPQQRAVLEGALAWDPRLDDTYPGGSGPQRLADPSTWAFTENPFLLGLRWALGIYRNGKRVLGIGMAVASINVDSAVQAANVADANGWKVGGVVYSTDPKYDVLKKICAAGSGEPIRVGGMLTFLVDCPRVSLDTITNNDIIGKCTVPSGARMKDKLNGCIPTYRSPTNDWQLVPATKVVVGDYVAADGRPRTKAITWELVQDPAQVAELASYAICNSREIDGIVLPLKIRWVGYKPGDAVTVKASVVAMDDQLVVFRKRVLDPATGAITFTARTETSAKHAYALGQTTTPPPTPALATVDRTGLLMPGITAAWSGVLDDNGKRPDDNATNSADPNSPFGSGTVQAFVNRVVNVEDYLAPSGYLQGRLSQLEQEIDNAGGGSGTDPRTDYLVAQVTSLEASARGTGTSSPNLLVNPDFADGTLGGWNALGSGWGVLPGVNGYDIGAFVQSGAQGNLLYQDVNIYGGTAYSFSAEMDPDTAGNCRVYVDWLGSSGSTVSGNQGSLTGDGWNRVYTGDNTLVAPNNATKARIWLQITGSGTGRFTRIQFQRGGIPSPFRNDGSVYYTAARLTSEITLRSNLAGAYANQFNSLSAQFAGSQGSFLLSSITTLQQTVSTNNTTISQRVDTISSSIKALSAPNLIANGTFNNGFSGWNLSNSSNWQVLTGYQPGPWAQYNGTDDGFAFTDVNGIQPGKNYCIGFDATTDNNIGGDYCHMYLEWWSANFGQYLGRVEIGPSSGFNRVSGGPYQAPGNAAIARVGIQGRNNGDNSAYGRKWRQVQLQQSETPTAYSDSASLQGLQAQVSTQAGTLADMSNKVNGTVLPRLSAYWQTQATVGSAQAFIAAKADLGNGNTATSVAIGAQSFYVLSDVNGQWVKAFEVSGGNTHIYGNLAVDGAVSLSNLQFGTGGLYSIWYNENVASTSSASQWQSFAQLELTPQDGQMIDGEISFVLSSSGADTDVLYRVRRDDGTIVKGGASGGGVRIRARAGGMSVHMAFVDSVPAGRDTTWYWECIKASDAVNINMESCDAVVEEVGRGLVQHATITTAGGQGPGAGSGGGGNINGGQRGGGFANSNNRQF